MVQSDARQSSDRQLKLRTLRAWHFHVRETGKESAMQVPPYPALSLRTNISNPNHHLWLNNGTWFAAYTVLTSPLTAERIRTSLRTKEVAVARQRRDQLFQEVGHVRAA